RSALKEGGEKRWVDAFFSRDERRVEIRKFRAVTCVEASVAVRVETRDEQRSTALVLVQAGYPRSRRAVRPGRWQSCRLDRHSSGRGGGAAGCEGDEYARRGYTCGEQRDQRDDAAAHGCRSAVASARLRG